MQKTNPVATPKHHLVLLVLLVLLVVLVVLVLVLFLVLVLVVVVVDDDVVVVVVRSEPLCPDALPLAVGRGRRTKNISSCGPGGLLKLGAPPNHHKNETILVLKPIF